MKAFRFFHQSPFVIRLATLALAAACLLPRAVHAQATSGSILGHVTDPSGALIIGADVTATNLDTRITFHGLTDATGTYDLLHVTPGHYSITASRTGFASATTPDAAVAIDQQLLQNFTLKPGEVQTVTTVTTAPTLLQTQTAETGTVIGTADILDLPLLGRQFTDLTALVPGVAPAAGNMNAYNYSVNGEREFANSIQLDGIESTTNRTQDITVTPSVDSIQEFKVTTSSYNAEFGNAGGGIVSVQTKAGTNHIHGDVYEFYRPNFLAAEEYAFGPGTPSVLKQNNYGGTIGGPIRKDHSFLFISYEGMKQSTAANGLDSVPPIGMVNFLPDGSVDLSHMVDPCAGHQCNGSGPAAGFVVPLFNPYAYVSSGYVATPFPTNDVIPANLVSTAGKNTLLDFFPKPNLPGIENGWFDNYAFHQPRTIKNINVDSRFDQKLSSRDQLFLVYHYNDQDQDTTDIWDNQAVVAGAGDADQAQREIVRGQTLSATETHLFTQHLLNEIRAGYSHYYQGQFSTLNGHDYSTQYGWGNIAVSGYPATIGYPDIYLGSGYLAGGSSYKPFFINDDNTEIDDNLTISQVGRHDLKFGILFRKLNSHPLFSLFPTTYQYFGSFGYSMTNDPNYGTYTGGFFWDGGTDIADLLLGLPLDVYSGLQLTDPHTRSWEFDWYAQDTFRVNDKLTLNYGLRYEFQNPYTEAKNQMSNFDLSSGDLLVAGVGGNSDALLEARKNDFSPRFGFDYLITPKTVIRGGYGINYSPENDGREDFLTKNLPFASQNTYSNNVYAGPPFTYQDDVGVPRNTTITIPSSGRIAPSTLPDGKNVTSYYVNPTMKTGYSEMFNLTVQRQIGQTLSLEAGYVGSLSHHLSYRLGDINYINSASSDGLINSNLGVIQELTDLGDGNYNSLQVKFTKRESRNLSFLLSYTYAHNLDNGAAPFDAGVNNDLPQNPNNLRAEWASADDDVRHNMVFSGLYRLPIGQGQRFFNKWGRPEELILGGWQINSIFTMRSGTPINVVDEPDPNSPSNSRPNVVGNPNLPRSKRTLKMYFNTAAFVENTETVGGQPVIAPGDAGRNIVSGPGYINLDFSLFKEFAMTERYKLQTRLETFNTLNTPHFNNPGGNMTDTTSFGVITGTNGQNRVVQLAAKFLF
ncbi:MAG TPA: TonB-dependent receptor [Candidatus Aquilonibacter sp.]|nr:TonB-dependent receptor [Candidatus Aquilonibacter sp.]